MGIFIKQWFTFTFKKDNVTNLLYNCSNNHYIHNWLEERGYTDFENIMSKEDLDKFLNVLNESSNMIPDCFDTHFPVEENFNFNKKTNFNFNKQINLSKEQMSELFESLWDIQDMIEDGIEGILKYNVYYVH